ncbi:MAG: nicotinamide-nucleotide amidohydrolase family protein [Methylobacillus sp.]|nr:nicotinamide-nucleotide amidohydrolase family protein [Methylobacillus sp.]
MAMADNALITLAAELQAALIRRGWKLALAESCTGGMAAQTVTAIPGSSACFERGFVTYSNPSKIEMLGVQPQTLARHGAVSEETAKEMAQGALRHSPAHLAAAITGIAGPDGGSPEKPVGTVCFAWANANGYTRSATHCFAGDRDAVRRQSVETVLRGLLEFANGGV